MSRDAALLFVVVLALVAIGLVMLYSATGVTAEKSPRYQDGEYFLKRQLAWAAVSVPCMLLLSRVPYRVWERGRWVILGVTVVALVLVFVPGVGAKINAARRWIRLGGFYVQPSEMAKIGIAVFLAAFAAADPERLKRFFRGFLPACLILGGVAGLILVEPDVGTALFITLVMGLMLLVAGVRIFHGVPVAVAGAGLVAFYALTHTGHVERRLAEWGTGYQVTQSLVALGSGGWTGEGLGRGRSKLYFLPEAHSDFIFPVLGEELGFVGAACTLLLYAALGILGYRIMRRAPDRFSFLLSFALTTYIILQAAVNVAVVTAAVPTKGIPLPFVSAGGSSLLFTTAGVGILAGIANAAEGEPCRAEGGRASCLPAEAPAVTSSPASLSLSTR
jgi:cell division protein FtsW